MTTNIRDQLRENCIDLAKQLEQDGENRDATTLERALDIEFTCGARGTFLGARVLLAFGGPNIWVNTRNNRVEGSWGVDRVEIGFDDDDFIHEACEQYFDCL